MSGKLKKMRLSMIITENGLFFYCTERVIFGITGWLMVDKPSGNYLGTKTHFFGAGIYVCNGNHA